MLFQPGPVVRDGCNRGRTKINQPRQSRLPGKWQDRHVVSAGRLLVDEVPDEVGLALPVKSDLQTPRFWTHDTPLNSDLPPRAPECS